MGIIRKIKEFFLPVPPGELPEQTTRQLAEGKNALPEGKPKEHQKAILG